MVVSSEAFSKGNKLSKLIDLKTISKIKYDCSG